MIAAMDHVQAVLPYPLTGLDMDYADIWIMPTLPREPLSLAAAD